MYIRHYEVTICDGCINLEGQECHTPECAFCFMNMDEVKETLRRVNLRVEFESLGDEPYIAEPISVGCKVE